MTYHSRSQREDCVKMYLAEAGHHRILTREEEVALFQRMEAGDDSAREELVTCNLRFVVKVAARYRGCGLPLADLIQEGNIGLLQVVDKFDWRRGFRFSTYAAYYIRQEIQSALHRSGSMIRLPIRKSRLLVRVVDFMQDHVEKSGQEPDAATIAEGLGVEVEKVEAVLECRHSVTSLDAEYGDESQRLEETLADESAASPRERITAEQSAAAVHHALDFLSERERDVLSARYGLGAAHAEPLSLRQASTIVGLSQEGVRRVEMRAFGKLRRPALMAHLRGEAAPAACAA